MICRDATQTKKDTYSRKESWYIFHKNGKELKQYEKKLREAPEYINIDYSGYLTQFLHEKKSAFDRVKL